MKEKWTGTCYLPGDNAMNVALQDNVDGSQENHARHLHWW